MRLLDDYAGRFLRRDLIAALTVAAIALPQGMAYAQLAGVDPRYGLFSAILVTAVASIFGSSSHLINGPTSAISLVVFGALAMFDPEQRVEATEAMFLLGAMVGSIQILISVFRLGDLTRHISDSVILGFMTAAAFLLALSQIGNVLGLKERGTGAQHVLHRLWLTVSENAAPNFRALAVTLSTLVLAIVFRKLVRRYRLPQFDMLLALVLVSLGATLAGWTGPGPGAATQVAVNGHVDAALPHLHVPVVRLHWVLDLASDSVAIAFLGLLEALAIAKAIANDSRRTLDFNRQCLAEGLANLAGGFFQCLPGSGSLSRSAINYQAGAVTRLSGIFTAGFVTVAVLVLAPLAHDVPKPALAALLLLTAARLIDLKRLAYTMRASRMDAGIVVATAASAIAFGLDDAILIGVALSVALFVPRAAKLKVAELVIDASDVVRERRRTDHVDEEFVLFDLQGELFFGAAPELQRTLPHIRAVVEQRHVSHVLLPLKRVRTPDVVSLEQFEQFLKQAGQDSVRVWLAGVQPDLLAAFQRLRFLTWFPPDRLFPQGSAEDSATLAAIRCIRSELSATATVREGRLYYLM